jgi:adenine-specific DNA-methyltransferase
MMPAKKSMPPPNSNKRSINLTRIQFREVETLHRRCGIYTNPEIVSRILDAVDWHERVNLSRSCLLEPAAGNGAFVVEAARRLVGSLSHHRIALTPRNLLHRIVAFELHPRESNAARSRVVATLCSVGVQRRTAQLCAQSWVVDGDFLLAQLPFACFTHTVGNPPYIRWRRVPPRLKALYEKRLPREMIGGDLFLPFLDKALRLLRVEGLCGFLCSDRWRFMAFAEGFRTKWLPRLTIKSERRLSSSKAFVDDVDSYPTIVIGTKRPLRMKRRTLPTRSRGQTLAELGCVIRVGPALGHTPAYVLNPQENDVESRLLRPWIDAAEIAEGKLVWQGRRVIAMYEDEKLVDLDCFPLLKTRLKRFRKILKKRSIVARGAQWFRPIDRVIVATWSRPKLLVPELAKVPRLAIDRSGAIPSHGVYAIFVPDDNVEALYEKLRDGKLAAALSRIAPRVKGNYIRCYRRFLRMVRVE